MKILIVEDDESSLKILRVYLEQYRIVDTAIKVKEAIEKIKECISRYLLMFLDEIMKKTILKIQVI
jgi:DNA-binding response OmpR family regulator